MADTNAQSRIPTLGEASGSSALPGPYTNKSPYADLFRSNVPPAPVPTLATLGTLSTPWPANTAWNPPDRRPGPREPASPRPATPPPSPHDAVMQAVQNMLDLTDQREAQLQQLYQRRQELVAKLQHVATIEQKLQAISQPVRFCKHCNRPLYIHLPDGTLEPCTRNNRFGCGYVKSKEQGQQLLVGYLDCIQGRWNAKGRRKYAARKSREQTGGTAKVLYMVDGKPRPQ